MDLGLTARSILFYYYKRSLQSKTINVTELSSILETSKANITQIIQTLGSVGYVDYQPYKPLLLTNNGLQRAEKIYRRILLIESYLFKTLSMPFFQCRAEAFAWEGAIFDSTLEKIEKLIDLKIGLAGDMVPDQKSLNSSLRVLKSGKAGNLFRVLAIQDLDSIDKIFLSELSSIYLETIVVNAVNINTQTVVITCNRQKIILPDTVAANVMVICTD